MLNRAFKLSSTWKLFHQECERLTVTLCYPEELVQSTIRQFIESRVSEDAPTQQQELKKQDPESKSCCLLKTRSLQTQCATRRPQPEDQCRHQPRVRVSENQG